MIEVTVELKGRTFTIKCPYCGKKHHHGAGPPGVDPRNFLGHRVAHCTTPPEPGRETRYWKAHIRAGYKDGYVLVMGKAEK